MTQLPLLDRRRFLLGAAPAVTIAALGVSACSKTSGHADRSAYSPTYFSATEWAFVNAAVGRLIPAEGAGPGGLQAGVPEFIDRQMELPYGHGAYFYMKGPFRRTAPQRWATNCGTRHARSTDWELPRRTSRPKSRGERLLRCSLRTTRIASSSGWKKAMCTSHRCLRRCSSGNSSAILGRAFSPIRCTAATAACLLGSGLASL